MTRWAYAHGKLPTEESFSHRAHTSSSVSCTMSSADWRSPVSAHAICTIVERRADTNAANDCSLETADRGSTTLSTHDYRLAGASGCLPQPTGFVIRVTIENWPARFCLRGRHGPARSIAAMRVRSAIAAKAPCRPCGRRGVVAINSSPQSDLRASTEQATCNAWLLTCPLSRSASRNRMRSYCSTGMSTDRDTVPISHPAQKQALADLLTRLEETVDTSVTQQQIDIAQAEVARDMGW